VVFLVKNGIGFGHIRRALILAQALQRDGALRPVVISQARGLDLLLGAGVDVVNFPLLHRLPSAVAEDRYLELLDVLLDRLDPVVVIEDTYPDPRYGRLPALAGRARLLIMRRLVGASFDQIRHTGALARYDKILIAQDPDQFHREGHSGPSLAAVEHGQFTIVGNVAIPVTSHEAETARRAHAPQGGPLVVVAAGAGGDQLTDGFTTRLFTAVQHVADRFRDARPELRFVAVTGPYHPGRLPTPAGNLAVHRFHPDLPALLAGADVAVIKPGNNCLSEALAGRAQLILVPDASFLEGVSEHARRVVAEHGGQVCPRTPSTSTKPSSPPWNGHHARSRPTAPLLRSADVWRRSRTRLALAS